MKCDIWGGSPPGTAARAQSRQAGVAAIEFALLAIVFVTLVVSVIELGRGMFVINTLYEVTRHAANAAAVTSHADTTALDAIRQRAVLRNSPGTLLLSAPVSDASVRFKYFSLPRAGDGALTLQEIPTASLPTCARRNREICMANPNAENCIRFVSASICDERNQEACNAVLYHPIVPLISFPLALSKATTMRAVESFGSMPEGTPCL